MSNPLQSPGNWMSDYQVIYLRLFERLWPKDVCKFAKLSCRFTQYSRHAALNGPFEQSFDMTVLRP